MDPNDPFDPLDCDRLADIVDEQYEELEARRRADERQELDRQRDDEVLAAILRRAIADTNIELQGMALMGIGPLCGIAHEDCYLTTLDDKQAGVIRRVLNS